MKKGKKTKKKSKSKKRKTSRIHHHGKLFVLLPSRLALAFGAFLIGLYLGYLFADPPLLILIAFVVGIFLYLFSILHVIKWLKI
jgi:uncharacterized membrane protein YjjP (DUF1212 family)